MKAWDMENICVAAVQRGERKDLSLVTAVLKEVKFSMRKKWEENPRNEKLYVKQLV